MCSPLPSTLIEKWVFMVFMSFIGVAHKPVFASTQQVNTNQGNLDVVIENVKLAKGVIYCSLFSHSNADSFPSGAEKADISQTVKVGPVDDSPSKCQFKGLISGSYAVAVMHDENNNSKMDTNFIGMPVEGWGVSNNVGPGLLGPPSFEEARVDLKPGDNLNIRINLRH